MRVLLLLAVLASFGCVPQAQEFSRYERCVNAYRDHRAVKASAPEVHEVCMEASAR